MVLNKEHFADLISLSISSAGEGTMFIVSSACLSSIPVVKWLEEFLKMIKDARQLDKDYQAATK
jgi:hypothetical protein